VESAPLFSWSRTSVAIARAAPQKHYLYSEYRGKSRHTENRSTLCIAHAIEINSRVAAHLHKFNGSRGKSRSKSKAHKTEKKCVKKVQQNQIKKSTEKKVRLTTIKQSSRVPPFVNQRLIKETAIISSCSYVKNTKNIAFVIMCFHS